MKININTIETNFNNTMGKMLIVYYYWHKMSLKNISKNTQLYLIEKRKLIKIKENCLCMMFTK